MIAIHDHGAVRELQLSRPPVNALNPELLAALVEAVAAAPGEGAGAIVISGSEGCLRRASTSGILGRSRRAVGGARRLSTHGAGDEPDPGGGDHWLRLPAASCWPCSATGG
jgi:hypothetical protein